jgi:acetyl esterase
LNLPNEVAMAIDPELLSFYQGIGKDFAPLTANATPAMRRQFYLDVTQRLAPANLNGLHITDLTMNVAHRTLNARSYSPQAHKPTKLMVFFHGGGWVIGDMESHHALCADLSRALGITVVSVDYRLAPEFLFPAAHEDAVAAVLWCSEQLLSFGCSEILVGGDSAGANLAAYASAQCHGVDGLTIAAQYLIYPVVSPNFTRPSYRSNAAGPGLSAADMQWYWRTYCPIETRLFDPSDARLNLLSQAWTMAPPPTVLVTAGLDPLCDEGLAYAEFLAKAGAPLRLVHAPDMPHGFIRLSSTSAAVRRWFQQLVLPI